MVDTPRQPEEKVRGAPLKTGGETTKSVREKLSGVGSKLSRVLPRKPTDEELDRQIARTKKEAELAEAKARKVKARRTVVDTGQRVYVGGKKGRRARMQPADLMGQSRQQSMPNDFFGMGMTGNGAIDTMRDPTEWFYGRRKTGGNILKDYYGL